MSITETVPGDRFSLDLTPQQLARRLAVLAAGGLVLSYLQVLRRVTIVVGGQAELLVVAVTALVAATVSARYVPTRAAVWVGAGGFVVGVVGYLLVIPEPFLSLATVGNVLGDLWVLVTGNLSVMQILAADVWTVVMAPAPIYLTWYFALRGRYEYAAATGGLALGFLVLTGDAGTGTTLVGATSLLAMLGLGSFEGVDVRWEQLLDLGLVLLATVLLTRLVRLVPASGLTDGPSLSGSGADPTLEGGLVTGGDTANIYGSVSLSSSPRFEVTATRPALWHVAGYDRYTGRHWVRSGKTRVYRPSDLTAPPSDSERVVQRFEALSSIGTVPAAWKPVEFEGGPPMRLQITSEQGLQPQGALSEGDAYTVISEVPAWSTDRLQSAGTDYPGIVTQRYLQLPDDLPTRVSAKADDIAGDAETPYDAAVAVSRWLAERKRYSLDVNKPDGDVVDAFLFGMDRGYCVYFATAMTVLLRTQGIPARYATGYTPGERLSDGRWLVRGLHSHAWVEVYFPDVGWVPFDPTPSGPRRAAEQERLEQSNAAGRPEGGGNATATPTPTPSPTPTETATNGTPTTPTLDPGLGGEENPDVFLSPTETPQGTNESTTTGPQVVAGQTGPVDTPGDDLGRTAGAVAGRDRLTMLVGAAGVLLGAYRFRVLQRGYDQVRLRWQPDGDSPEVDVVRAFERLELLLSKEYRDRGESETPRDYLDHLDGGDVDGRARRVGELYERAYYGSDVTTDDAAEAIRLVDELVREHSRFP